MQVFNWFLLAAMLFCLASWIGNWSENTELKSQLAHKEEVIDQKDRRIADMHEEHRLAIAAATEALQLRKEIGEYERQRMCEAERALGKNPAYCNGLVPDDVRMLWQPDAETGAAAAGGASRGH